MKKAVIAILTIILTFSMCVSASANSNTLTPDTHENCSSHDAFEVIFHENTPFTAEDQEYIASVLATHGEQSSTYGFSCWLLGHKYEYDTVSTITHCVNSTDPRCLKEFFEIGLCSRCGDTTTELIGQQYISCCP